jgi:hypothetical protein
MGVKQINPVIPDRLPNALGYLQVDPRFTAQLHNREPLSFECFTQLPQPVEAEEHGLVSIRKLTRQCRSQHLRTGIRQLV